MSPEPPSPARTQLSFQFGTTFHTKDGKVATPYQVLEMVSRCCDHIKRKSGVVVRDQMPGSHLSFASYWFAKLSSHLS